MKIRDRTKAKQGNTKRVEKKVEENRGEQRESK